MAWFYRFIKVNVLGLLLLIVFQAPLHAQNIPNAADVGKIKPQETIEPPVSPSPSAVPLQNIAPDVVIPNGADSIHFVLKNLNIKGVTAFSPKAINALYKESMNTNITLETIYRIAEKITKY